MFFKPFYLRPLLWVNLLPTPKPKKSSIYPFNKLDFHVNYLWRRSSNAIKNRNVLKTNGVNFLRVHPVGITPGKLIRVNLLAEISAHKSKQALSTFEGKRSSFGIIFNLSFLTDKLSAEVLLSLGLRWDLGTSILGVLSLNYIAEKRKPSIIWIYNLLNLVCRWNTS